MLKRFKNLLIVAVLASIAAPMLVLAARTNDLWLLQSGTTYLQTNYPGGLDLLINGASRYLNFNTVTGSSGYGFRDNSGTMEFKNSGGSWTGVGSGGSVTGSVGNWFTPTTYGTSAANATSTLIGFLQGMYSTASSTIGNGAQAGGLTINGGATTTGNAYFGNRLGIATTSPYAALSVVGSSGIVAGKIVATSTGNSLSDLTDTGLTSGLVGNNTGLLYSFASSSLFGYTPLNPTRQLTVAGTVNQITSSAGAQDLSSDRTWTISLPNHVIFPIDFLVTNSSTTNATTTGNSYFTGITASRPLYVDSTGKLTSAGSGVSGNCVNWGANNTLGDAGSACGSGGGSSYGEAWQFFSNKGWLAPTSTVGIIISASSTVGDGTQIGGLTINGGATTTGNATFLGTVAIPQNTAFKDTAGNTHFQFTSATVTQWSGFIGNLTGLGVGGFADFNFSQAYNKLVNAVVGTAPFATTPPTNGLIIQGLTGVGSSTPFAKLSVHAMNGDTNTALFAIGSSTQTATTTLFSISNTGTITTAMTGTQCVHEVSGVLSGTGSDCGSGGGNSFSYPFPANATSSVLTFSGGLVTNGSTTISSLGSGLVGANNGLLYAFASSSLFGYTPLNPTRAINTTWPIQGGGDLSADRTFTFGGLSTSTAAVVGNIPYFSGVNTFANVATTTASCTGSASCTPFVIIGSSPVTINASAGGGTFAFTPTTNFGVNSNATSTLISFNAGLAASSTAYFSDISTTGQFKFATTSSATSTLITFGGRQFLNASSSDTVGNLFFGLDAGSKDTSGYNDTGFGYRALSSNTFGNHNTAVGYEALIANTNGIDNTAIGFLTLYTNVLGGNNTAIGYQALANNTSSNNTAVGYSSLLENTTGNWNQAFGQDALGSNNVGSKNSAFGLSALFSNTSGIANIGLGYQAGYDVSSGADNIFIGHTENTGGGAITTGSGNIGLGYNIVFPTVSTNRMLNIGNFLFANLPATSTATALQVPTSGLFSVGSSSPFAKLSVQTNNGDTTKTLFAIGSSTATATTTLFSIDNMGSTTMAGPIFNTSSATSTFAQGLNLTAGCFAVRGVCLATGGSVTSVGLALPTGFTITNSPVTTTGTLTGAFTSAAYGIRKIPSYTVGAAGADFTTIQGALDQCGVDHGGNIALTDPTYAQGGTGLTFKGSNCHLVGRGLGTTTITFTGATTLFKTNSAAGQYTNNSIENISVSGDGNTAGIAFNLSDMSHFVLQNTTIDNVGTWVRYDDTQNISFYNTIRNNQATTLTAFGLNASSTNPWNGNIVEGNFIGCAVNNCVGIQVTNANGNRISDNYVEPDGTKTGVIDIKIFDNAIATCNGVFNNTISGNYLEGGLVAGTQGMSIATGLCSNGGIQRNYIENNTNENHTLDWAFPSATSSIIAKQSFVNNYNSNFDFPLTSFQSPFNISTSSELAAIGVAPYCQFCLQSLPGIASNIFVIGSTTEIMKINNAGNTIFHNIVSFLDHIVITIAAAFTPATEGEIGIDTTDNQLKYFASGAVRVVSPTLYTSFSYATSTWVGTTTRQLGPAGVNETWQWVKCTTDVGTVQVSFYNVTGSRMNWINASTTVGTTTLSSNNSFASSKVRYVDIGTPATAPTQVSCTIARTIDPT